MGAVLGNTIVKCSIAPKSSTTLMGKRNNAPFVFRCAGMNTDITFTFIGHFITFIIVDHLGIAAKDEVEFLETTIVL